MIFRFTNDQNRYEKAIAYRNAAIADGWSCTPLYPDESVEQVSKLEKDEFTMFILTRTDIGSWKYEVEIALWGPDGLIIVPPEEYDMNLIKKNIMYCNYCKKDNVETQRVGFAGRVCKECLPEEKKRQEYPGWDN